MAGSSRSSSRTKTARGRKGPAKRPPKAPKLTKPGKAAKPKKQRLPTCGLPKTPTGERVLALDSSSKACGWSLFEAGQLISYGKFLQKGKGHGERLMHFRQWILAMLQEFRPTQLVYEKPYSGRMKNTFGILSRYAGVIELAHFEHFQAEMPADNAVAAHLIKKAIGAKKGRNHEQNKKIVLLLINQVFGLSLKYKSNDQTKKISEDDTADGIACNWAWHILQGYGGAALAEEDMDGG